MTVTGTYVDMALADRITTRLLQLAFSGNYVNQANGGDIIDLKTVANSQTYFDSMKNWSGRRPLIVYPLSASGGYYFELIPVANQPTQFIVKIYAPGGAELGNGVAYSAQTGGMSGGHNLTNPDSPFSMGFDVITGT